MLSDCCHVPAATFRDSLWKHCSQSRQPAALPFLSREAYHRGKAYLHRGEGWELAEFTGSALRSQAKRAGNVFCSCDSNSCFQVCRSLVQSARCHSKTEAVRAAVLLLCAALPQWIKTLFSRAVEMVPFRRNQHLKIRNKTKDWL